jgi:eukaryotic-like serine/threonine-protein kinase
MDMFVQHCTGEFERPSRLVLDVPVWLDNLICQLLEKKPDQRPLNAELVYRALGSIQEKVEAQQSAGVEAARGRMIDRPRGARHADEEDKDAARSLRTGKSKTKRKRKTAPFYTKVWFHAAGVLAILGFLAGVLWLVTRPARPEKLYAQAKKLMDSPDLDKHEEAYSGPIHTYRGLYASREGEETTQILAWKKQVELEQSEATLNKLLHGKFKREPANDAERDAVRALKEEEEGSLEEAEQKWKEMTRKYDPASGYESWGVLADNHLSLIRAVPEREKTLLALLLDPRGAYITKGVEPTLEGMDQKAYTGLRFEHLEVFSDGRGDLPRALHLFKEMKDNTANDKELHFWEVFAAWKCKTLEKRLPDKEEPNARKKLVQEAVQIAQMHVNDNPQVARAIALNVAALYGEDADLESLVKQARQLAEEVKK